MNKSDLFGPPEAIQIQPPEESRDIVAAIYARTSGPNQRFGYSIEGQVQQCIRRCKFREWTVGFVFRDEAESGDDRDRPMFQEMMAKAEKGSFDVIVFWKLDRFSRSLIHAVQLEEQLRQQDIALHSVTEMIDTTTPAGRFNFRNLASAAEFERDMIQQRTKLGMNQLADQHKWPNDQPPLGYRKREDDKLDVIPGEATLVRRIFHLYIELRSMPDVAERLNKEGEVTKRGNEWTTRSVGKVLRNELYVGEYAVADVEDYVPEYQILDRDTFETATEIRHRFQQGNGSRPPMDSERKERNVREIVDEYKAYLTN